MTPEKLARANTLEAHKKRLESAKIEIHKRDSDILPPYITQEARGACLVIMETDICRQIAQTQAEFEAL